MADHGAVESKLNQRITSVHFGNSVDNTRSEEAIKTLLWCPNPHPELEKAMGLEGEFAFDAVVEATNKQEEEEAFLIKAEDEINESVPVPENAYPNELKVQRDSLPESEFVPRKFVVGRGLKKLQSYKPFEKLVYWEHLSMEPSHVRLIYIDDLDTHVNNRKLKQVGKLLSKFVNCERIFLRNAQISNLDTFVFPKLLQADFSSNQIKTVKQMLKFCQNSRQLAMLNVSINPVTMCGSWSRSLPEPRSDGWRLVALCPWLDVLNNDHVPVEAHIEALNKYGSPEDRAAFALRRFDESLPLRIPAINGMRRWKPSKVTAMDLSGLGLETMVVGCFKNLKTLVASNNSLTTLMDMGLEQLGKLEMLDLSNNKLAKKDDAAVFTYLPRLLNLNLKGNPLDGCRLEIIFTTRMLIGSPSSAGLQVLSEEPITLDERVLAFKSIGRKSKDEVARKQWVLHVQRVCDRRRLANLENIRSIMLSGCALSYADVGDFVNLEFLDLSNNLLSEVEGLNQLRKLKVISLAGNKNLKVDVVISSLLETPAITTLESVAISPVRTTHKKRINILGKLFNNSKLRMLDGTPILPSERVETYAKLSNVSKSDLQLYQRNLAIVMSTAKCCGREYTPDRVAPGKQFRATEVTELLRMSHLGLTETSVMFTLFPNLVKLNLSHNNIAKLDGMGLDELPYLRELDVTFNQIKDKPHQIGEFLDKLSSLQIVAVRGNPGVSGRGGFAKARLKVMGAMQRMKKVTCRLRVLDTPVTVTERVDAWKQSGGDPHHCERLRTDIALRECSPPESEPETMEFLCMEDFELRELDLSNYHSLRVLRLRGNYFDDITALGLERLHRLECLDLRDNCLNLKSDTVLEQIAALTRQIPALRYLGLGGNSSGRRGPRLLGVTPRRQSTVPDNESVFQFDPDTVNVRNDQRLRKRIIRALPQLLEPNCKLRYIDQKELSIDEVVAAMDATELVRERFRWKLILFRSIGDVSPLDVNEMNLSKMNLHMINLAKFKNIERLSLAGNKLTGSALATGNFEKARLITELDISDNKIRRIDHIITVMNELPALRSVTLKGNPCYMDDTPELRMQLVGSMKRARRRGFPLAFINGQPVTLQERVDGVGRYGNVAPDKLEKLRLKFTMESMKLRGDEVELDLSNCGLVVVQLCMIVRRTEEGNKHCFTDLIRLNLAQNCITTLYNQGMSKLELVENLDLRGNRLDSLEAAVLELRDCHSLRHLWLKDSTESPTESRDPAEFSKMVFLHLKGLETCDDIANPNPLTAEQADAAQFLHDMAGVGVNHLYDVDLSDQKLEEEHFFWVLGALTAIPCRSVRLNLNPWDESGVGPQHAHYRRYLIAGLGDKLEKLDGVPIDDDERAAAIQYVMQEEQEFGPQIKKHRWSKLRSQCTMVLSSMAGAKLRARMRRRSMDEGEILDEEADEADVAIEVDSSSALVNAMEGAVSVVREATGSLLNKFEVLISFLQVYGLVLAIDLTIEWPNVWEKFSAWFAWLAEIAMIDIDLVFERFDVQIPSGYHEYVKFAAIMIAPMILVLFYKIANGMNKEAWIRAYYRDWKMYRNRAIFVYIFSLVMTFTLGVAVDYNISVVNLENGRAPSGKSNTVIALGWGFITAILLVWIIVVSTFRCKYIVDAKHKPPIVGGNNFQTFWSASKRILQRLSLFLLTISYMPVTSTIFNQFAGEVHVGRLDIAGCQHFSSSGQRCCLKRFPTQPCINSPESTYLSIIQVLALFFALFYVVGIPFFFVNLIRKGVEQVDRVGYSSRSRVMRGMINSMKQRRKLLLDKEEKTKAIKDEIRALNKKIKSMEKDVRNLYSQLIDENPKAQSYLYQAYERKWRYYKIFQMAEKCLLVCVTLYLMNMVGALRLMTADIIVGLMTLFTFISGPFVDHLEDKMDALGRLTNTVNVFVALSLDKGWMGDWIASGTLLVFNGSNIVYIVFAFLATPIRACLSNRRYLKQLNALKSAGQAAANTGVAAGRMAAGTAEAASRMVRRVPSRSANAGVEV